MRGWQYVPLGYISGVAPSSGQIGTRVIISGSGLLSGGRSNLQVFLNGVAATVVSSGNGQVQVVAKAGVAGGAGSVQIMSSSWT